MSSDPKIQQWLTEFMDYMYPGDDELGRSESQEQADARVHTGRVRATWIVERLIETGRARDL